MPFYLRCESEITIVDGQINCSAWQSVSEDELLGAMVRQSMLSREDYLTVGHGITAIMVVVIGIRVVLKLLSNPQQKGESP